MSRIRNVVFDLGGVMINYNPRQYVEEMGLEGTLAEEVCDAIFYDPVWGDMDRGIYANYLEALPVFIERHPHLEKEIRAFFHQLWHEVYSLKEDTEKILYDWVYEKGYDIYILSNFSEDGFAYIEKKYPFFKKARGYVVSAYEKCVKPEPRIYGILLDRFGLKADECVFIDDFEVNVQGARDVGMESFVFRGPEDAKTRLIEMGL